MCCGVNTKVLCEESEQKYVYTLEKSENKIILIVLRVKGVMEIILLY